MTVRSPAALRSVAGPRGGTRADIQGLRAVAVAAVLAFHLWPGVVRGGYVGVDVFLVISGYLITAHLLREPPTTWRAVGRFWGRRVRRLLPASALVIVATVVIGAVVLPATQLERTGAAAVASALYVQNWSLAQAATDYLAASDAPTALQHYWSLSVEEQFYLGWPLLIGAAALLASRWRRLRAGVVVGAVVLVVLGVSLVWSARLTATDPAAAYFVTTTRIWELALGGTVAVIQVILAGNGRRDLVPARWAAPVAGAGLLAVVAAVVGFSSATPFPGTAALLPTMGTAAVIAAQTSERSMPGRLLGLRGAQLLGDVSYSTYLWHWPMIVLAPFAVHRALTWWELGGLALASVGLAWLTKRWVEDPVRRSPLLNRSSLATAGVLVLCTAAGAVAGTALQDRAADRSAREATAATEAAAAHPECLAAAALLPGADCGAFDGELWTTPVQAAADKPQVYADSCWNEQPYATRTTCTYGPEDAEVQIALVGNSHAGHWFPPLEAIAEERGWHLTTYLASTCYPVDVDLAFPDPGSTTGCSGWNAWVRGQVMSGGYDVVVMSARTDQHLADVPIEQEDALAQEAYARVLDEVTGAGPTVLVIRDTPNFPGPVPDCVAVSPDQDSTAPRVEAVEVDPLALAAAGDESGHVELLDTTDLLCDTEECHGVLGHAIVMFDHGHLTDLFAASLRPWMEPALLAALADQG